MRTFVCSIYEKRPKMCREYPKHDSYIFDQCGYFFPGDGTRRGSCEEECEATCCREPREGGEPGARGLPIELGGEPCKYLVSEEYNGEED